MTWQNVSRNGGACNTAKTRAEIPTDSPGSANSDSCLELDTRKTCQRAYFLKCKTVPSPDLNRKITKVVPVNVFWIWLVVFRYYFTVWQDRLPRQHYKKFVPISDFMNTKTAFVWLDREQKNCIDLLEMTHFTSMVSLTSSAA